METVSISSLPAAHPGGANPDGRAQRTHSSEEFPPACGTAPLLTPHGSPRWSRPAVRRPARPSAVCPRTGPRPNRRRSRCADGRTRYARASPGRNAEKPHRPDETTRQDARASSGQQRRSPNRPERVRPPTACTKSYGPCPRRSPVSLRCRPSSELSDLPVANSTTRKDGPRPNSQVV